jgi:hypothetical protein
MTIAGGREIANKDASIKVFALIIFIEVLLQMITERKCATLAPLALLHDSGDLGPFNRSSPYSVIRIPP